MPGACQKINILFVTCFLFGGFSNVTYVPWLQKVGKHWDKLPYAENLQKKGVIALFTVYFKVLWKKKTLVYLCIYELLL